MFTDNDINKEEEGRCELRRVQERVDEWIRRVGGGYFSELTNMVLLTEEVGELARIIARVFGDQVAKDGDLRRSLGEEMADVLWVLVCLANQTGVDLGKALDESFDKKEKRDAERFSQRRERNLQTPGSDSSTQS